MIWSAFTEISKAELWVREDPETYEKHKFVQLKFYRMSVFREETLETQASKSWIFFFYAKTI